MDIPRINSIQNGLSAHESNLHIS